MNCQKQKERSVVRERSCEVAGRGKRSGESLEASRRLRCESAEGSFDWNFFLSSRGPRIRGIAGAVLRALGAFPTADQVDELIQESFLRILSSSRFSEEGVGTFLSRNRSLLPESRQNCDYRPVS